MTHYDVYLKAGIAWDGGTYMKYYVDCEDREKIHFSMGSGRVVRTCYCDPRGFLKDIEISLEPHLREGDTVEYRGGEPKWVKEEREEEWKKVELSQLKDTRFKRLRDKILEITLATKERAKQFGYLMEI